jgi:hypothetical protein
MTQRMAGRFLPAVAQPDISIIGFPAVVDRAAGV